MLDVPQGTAVIFQKKVSIASLGVAPKNESMTPLHVTTHLPKYDLCTKNEVMAPLHVDTLTVERVLPRFSIIKVSTLYLCTKNETMAPLHEATLTM